VYEQVVLIFFFFSSRRRHTRSKRDWSSDVCSSDLKHLQGIHTVSITFELFFLLRRERREYYLRNPPLMLYSQSSVLDRYRVFPLVYQVCMLQLHLLLFSLHKQSLDRKQVEVNLCRRK